MRISQLTIAGLLLLGVPSLGAAQTLTAVGIADGFTLATAYTGGGGYGLLSMTAAPDGTLIGAGYGYTQLLKFNEGAGNTVNGLTYGSAIATASTPGTPTGIATVGGNVYVNILGDQIYKVSGALGLTALSVDTSLAPAYGLWANQTNGHLVVGTSNGVVDVNPTTGHVTQIGATNFVDGVSVSADGTVAYVEEGGRIKGYSLASPNPASPVFDSGTLYNSTNGNANPSPDGTAVIYGGTFAGDIIVNNNDGSIGMINPTITPGAAGFYVTIATGEGRGDLVSPDANNGSLLLADFNQVLRLSLAGGSIGSAPTDVPEPASLALLGGALVGLGMLRRRRG